MDEQAKFCGEICWAARQLNIYGRIQEDYFVWFDPMNGARWKTPTGSDKKDILFKACESLVLYLN